MWELRWRDFLLLYSVFVRQKVIVIEKVSFINAASGWLQIVHKSEKRQWRQNLPTLPYFSCKFNYWSRFHVNIMTVLELLQFSLIKDWQEIWKSKIPPSEFCPISGNWGELVIPNLAWMSLIKCTWILQNTSVTAFTVSGLLRENQPTREEITPHTQIIVNMNHTTI